MSHPKSSKRAPPPEVVTQLATLELEPDRPLIISDADEVLFEFMAGFVAFIEERGCYFDWASFALTGNVRDRESERALDQDEVHELLQDFFDDRAERLDPVPGAADACHFVQLPAVGEVDPEARDGALVLRSEIDCVLGRPPG